MRNFAILVTVLFTLTLPGLMEKSHAAVGDSLPTIELDAPVHFLAPDGSDVVIKPGRYQVEAAESWLRLIPGERRDALLLIAQSAMHTEPLVAPHAHASSIHDDTQTITLLLPGGRSLEAIGSVSGIRSRVVKGARTSRTLSRTQQKSRIPTRSKQSAVSKKSKPLPKSPVQANDPLAQQVQTLEQHVSNLQATINALQNRLAKIESAIQVSNSGVVTVNGTTVKVNAAMVDVQAGLSKFSGVVKSDVISTNSVISKSYTPGAGNIW